MEKQAFIKRQVALATELIAAKKAFDNGQLSELGFKLVLLGAKATVLAEKHGFEYDDEIGEEVDNLVERSEWEQEALAKVLDIRIENPRDLRLGGSGSFLVPFVGEYIYYNYLFTQIENIWQQF